MIGDTPNLAARLQAIAQPGEVVIAEATRQLVGGLFECEDCGPSQVKGMPEPIRTYRVVRPAAQESRFAALHAELVPLVGRDEDLDILLRCWRDACDGRGRAVLISGEPGIGKSRLLGELSLRVGWEGHLDFRYHCAPSREGSPFHPVIAQLERAAGIAHDDPGAVRLARLERLLAATDAPLENVALLAELLSIPTSAHYPTTQLTSNRRRERTFAALIAQIEGSARRGPVLAIVEDAHWIDPSSQELLELILPRLAERRILLVVSHRPEYAPAWTAHANIVSLHLSRLDPDRGASLVRSVAGRSLADAVVAEIVERTDGVPLFIEELTKSIIEARDDAGPVLKNVSPAALAVPATLHALLLARLDRLGRSARHVAQVGAAIGREFPHDLLAAVADLREPELTVAMGQLISAGLLFAREGGSAPGYHFKHALVRDVAYGTLLRDRRRSIHAGLAQALERHFPDTAPEVSAHHWTEAGEIRNALNFWLEAGRRAADRSADREAVGHLRRGLDLLEGLPAGEDRDRRELDFQLAIGTPLIAVYGWSGQPVAAAYERASEVCERLGENSQLVTTLFGLASNRVVRGQTRVALSLAERCRASAERSVSPVDLMLAHRAMGAARMQLGQLGQARADFEAIIGLYDGERDRGLAARTVTDPRASGQSFLAQLLWIMGYLSSARRVAEEARLSAAGLDHANTTGHLLCHGSGERAQLAGDVTVMLCHARALLDLAAEHMMPMWRGYALVLLGVSAAEEGKLGEGSHLVRSGINELDALGTRFRRVHHLSLLARIEARLGDVGAGLALLREAGAEMAETEVRLFEAEIRRAEGDLLLMAGRSMEAEGCYAAAIQVARAQEAHSFELRAAAALARLLHERGMSSDAHKVLAQAYEAFPEPDLSPDVVAAADLLAELGRLPCLGHVPA